MKAAVMQPYLLPYLGYFQLIESVDVFVVYDNIKYTKKGWINRNRMLRDGRDVTFSLPLRRGSDSLDVRDRELAADFDPAPLLNRIRAAYAPAPHFARTFPLIEGIFRHSERNLFRFLHHSIARTCAHLGIQTEMRVSSDVPIDHGAKGQEKVLALCMALGADTYVNPIGGTGLYSKDAFRARGIDLRFIRSAPVEYRQFGDAFVPGLSIIDVMMFNPPETIRGYLAGFELT